MQGSSSTIVSTAFNIEKFSRLENVILIFMVFCVLLPSGPQYLFTGLLLLNFIFRKRWRGFSLLDGEGTYLFFGVLALFCSTWLVAFLQYFIDGTHSFLQVLSANWHLTGKLCTRGILIYWFFKSAYQRGWRLDIVLPYLLFFLLLCDAYGLLQMITGVDITHGLYSKLPPNRFNYGFYRVSGATGHPVTLGYSALLLGLTLVYLWLGSEVGTRRRQLTFYCLFSTCLLLLLTQTRWAVLVLVFCGLCFFISELKRGAAAGKKAFGKAWKWLLGLTVCIVLSSGLVGRFTELLDSRPLVEKIPRLTFWKVHWGAFLDNPLIGLGIVNRKDGIMDYYNLSGYNYLGKKYNAHNVFLQWLADSGVLGSLGLVALLVGVSMAASKVGQERSSPCWIFVVGTLLAGLLQNTFRDSEFVFAFWVCLSIILLDARFRSKPNHYR